MNDTVTGRLRHDSHVTHMYWMLTLADRAPGLLLSSSCRSLEPSSRSQTTRWRQNKDCSISWPEQPHTKPPAIVSFLHVNQGWSACTKRLTHHKKATAQFRTCCLPLWLVGKTSKASCCVSSMDLMNKGLKEKLYTSCWNHSYRTSTCDRWRRIEVCRCGG